MIDDRLLNPLNLGAEIDLPHAIQKIPRWTEHYFFVGYDPVNQFGICVHVGRLQEDSNIWRSVMQLYLPGEELLVLKSYGRGDERGPGAGPFKASCVDPFKIWVIDFDGAAYATTRSILARGLLQDGPAELVKFHMVFEAAGPVHSLLPGRELQPGMTVSSFHTSQVMRIHGSARFRNKDVTLDGMGVRNHSEGPRNYGPVMGNCWFHALFPSGKVVHVQETSFENFNYQSGFIFRGDGSPLEEIKPIQWPRVYKKGMPERSIDADFVGGADKNFRFVIDTKAGQEVLVGEIWHTHTITYYPVMEEFIGTALDKRGGIQMCDAPARVECGGEVGQAVLERSARTEALFVK